MSKCDSQPAASIGIGSKPGPLPVLFVHFGDEWIRGSEQVLLDLLGRLDPTRIHPVVWCNSAAMAEAARAAGFTTHRTALEFYFDFRSPPFSLRRYRALVREGLALVRTYGIRVLHANSAAPTQWLVPVARFARLPLLSILHAPYLRRSRYVLLLHQASLIVAVSQRVIADLIADGVPEERTQVIYNGIDFTRLQSVSQANLRCELGIGGDATVIASIGSLVQRKGHDVLIRALKLLNAPADVHLIIGGDGPERQSLEALAAQLCLQDRVHFLGYVEPAATYRASDIMALASREEAFGLVLAEAGYCGLPVVASAVGGIPEVVQNGTTGLLVPPDDPEALAAAFTRLISDPLYRRRLGATGKARVEELFSGVRMAAEFHATYDRLSELPRGDMGWSCGIKNLKPYFGLLRRASRPGSGAGVACRVDPAKIALTPSGD